MKKIMYLLIILTLVISTCIFKIPSTNASNENYVFLIVTTPDLKSAFQDLKDYHINCSESLMQADTVIKTIDTTNASEVRDFLISEKENNNAFQYLLIGGDMNKILVQY